MTDDSDPWPSPVRPCQSRGTGLWQQMLDAASVQSFSIPYVGVEHPSQSACRCYILIQRAVFGDYLCRIKIWCVWIRPEVRVLFIANIGI